MKDTLTDANFPRTADHRVYHLGLRPGEVANRIVTVGSSSRARTIASYLDSKPEPFFLESDRGFLTITGRYHGVPVSVVSIGMGSPNMDFFVREVRECLTGDMAIIRLGSCGGLVDMQVGSVVIPKSCVAITRNFDFDFVNPNASTEEPAYRISKLVSADEGLYAEVQKALNAAKPPNSPGAVVSGVTNASADSFYSSQGRQTSFPDHNSDLIEYLRSSVSDLATLEMETFHLYHLAACWGGRSGTTHPKGVPAPLTAGPVSPTISHPVDSKESKQPAKLASPDTVIRAAAAQMVFASRTSQDFITPQHAAELEHWTGKGILDALSNLKIQTDRLHSDEGSVWSLK